MAVKRKSNWYIYLIAFGIAMAFVIGVIFTFSWYLFPEDDKPTSAGLTSNGELDDNFKADHSYDFTVLTMLGDNGSTPPELFMMVSYDAVDNSVVFIPLPNGISVEYDERTLPNLYTAKGGEAVVSAVANATGVTCDGYICFDRDGFERLISAFGNVKYNVPNTIMVNDGTTRTAINAGEQMFSPEAVFKYIYLADFGGDINTRYNNITDVLVELLNQNIRYSDSSLLDNYFDIIMEECDTNLTEEMYMSKKAALLNSITYASDPGEYYVPYGEYGGDGSFDIADNSIISIKQKCGKDE